jgi:hypothetical protein
MDGSVRGIPRIRIDMLITTKDAIANTVAILTSSWLKYIEIRRRVKRETMPQRHGDRERKRI